MRLTRNRWYLNDDDVIITDFDYILGKKACMLTITQQHMKQSTTPSVLES